MHSTISNTKHTIFFYCDFIPEWRANDKQKQSPIIWLPRCQLKTETNGAERWNLAIEYGRRQNDHTLILYAPCILEPLEQQTGTFVMGIVIIIVNLSLICSRCNFLIFIWITSISRWNGNGTSTNTNNWSDSNIESG